MDERGTGKRATYVKPRHKTIDVGSFGDAIHKRHTGQKDLTVSHGQSNSGGPIFSMPNKSKSSRDSLNGPIGITRTVT